MKTTLTIPQPEISVEIYIGSQLLQSDFLKSLCKKLGAQIGILGDQQVKKLYGSDLSHQLNAHYFEVPVGERAKTREVKQQIEDQLFKAGFGKNSLIIGLGGGSTMDLAGFVASTFLRGISLIQMPTTLLGMVDASLGGKTAVDTLFGKNLIGTYYHPRAIVADLDTLNTLPAKERCNGLAEILKMGLIYDPEIMSDQSSLEELVVKAAKAKIAVVEKDPYETGLRRILNYGHTIGHALEAMSDYELSHGEAVAMGCVAESYLSHKLGYLTAQEFSRIEKQYQTKFDYLRLPKNYQRKALYHFMLHDKKKTAQGVRCVLISQIGAPISFDGQYCRMISEAEFELAFDYMEEHYAQS